MSSITETHATGPGLVQPLRLVSGVAAAAIIVDAISVRAPGLGLLAVPFLVAALGLRVGRTVTCIGLTLWALLYVAIGVNYAVGSGFDAPWGDIIGVYVGAACAAAVAGLSILRLARRGA